MDLIEILLKISMGVLIGYIIATILGNLLNSLETERKLNEIKIEYYQKILKEGERPWTTN